MDYSVSLSELSLMTEEERRFVSENMTKVASSEYFHGKWTLLERYGEWKNKVSKDLRLGRTDGLTNKMDMRDEL